jgi:isoamylase
MLVGLKLRQPVLHRPKFFQGRPIRGTEVKDIAWLDPSGKEMSDESWSAGFVRSIAVRLAGDAIDEVNERGQRLVGDTLLLLFNADANEIAFTLPGHNAAQHWSVLFDTAVDAPQRLDFTQAQRYSLQSRCVAVFRLVSEEEHVDSDQNDR